MPRKKRERVVPEGVKLDPRSGHPMIQGIAPLRGTASSTLMFMGEEADCQQLVENYFLPRGATPRRVETPVVQWFVDIRYKYKETVRRKMAYEKHMGRLARWEFGHDPDEDCPWNTLFIHPQQQQEKGALN